MHSQTDKSPTNNLLYSSFRISTNEDLKNFSISSIIRGVTLFAILSWIDFDNFFNDFEYYIPRILVFYIIFHAFELSILSKKQYNNLNFSTFLHLTLGALFFTPGYFALFILYGFHFTSFQILPLLLGSLFLTIFSTLPIILYVNFSLDHYPLINISSSIEKHLLPNLSYQLLGGILSSIVLPLDWERNWQQWPVPLVFGVGLGSIVGGTISLIQLGNHDNTSIKED
ncbi:hypothetical protein CONCODRAFT_78328 [Conidiobolus coronatus NRRL 28638]|uniref:Glycosylphosphatidylinositol anchor biosynthesis protein 11 n=1 Tax=Conidiobolus coronatus (strain ATCC 28846 / CBS 209.66 / NRRL 28638) TaxID=796925 RepID=A0A137P8T4_CONC2|nr:hypothetical protein CONCODRAFT_78328 [Conidiobolus coronatus NRRL 28638]|eukprot:KXN71418.1 hypothetical protein CONCODRAFT_78328 [Conidiobolus coronatus NRRL 28638]